MHDYSIKLMGGILRLVLIFLIAGIAALLGVLPLNTTRSTSAERRLQAEVNVLLGIQPDDK